MCKKEGWHPTVRREPVPLHPRKILRLRASLGLKSTNLSKKSGLAQSEKGRGEVAKGRDEKEKTSITLGGKTGDKEGNQLPMLRLLNY